MAEVVLKNVHVDVWSEGGRGCVGESCASC